MTRTVEFRPLWGGAGVQMSALVDEYEPGFAQGKAMQNGRPVLLRWDGDEWMEVEPDDVMIEEGKEHEQG